MFTPQAVIQGGAVPRSSSGLLCCLQDSKTHLPAEALLLLSSSLPMLFIGPLSSRPHVFCHVPHQLSCQTLTLLTSTLHWDTSMPEAV